MLQQIKMKIRFIVIIILSLIFSAPVFSRGGDPEALEVLNTWRTHYEESIEGIDDFIVVKEQQTIYYEKAYDNGRPYFQARVETEAEEDLESTSPVTDADLFSKVYSSLQEKAIYKGTDEVNGHHVHVIYVNELEGIFDPDMPQIFKDVYLRIDPDKWVLREAQHTAEIEYEGGVRKVTQVMQNRDWRDVKGMQVAYETAIIIRGLSLTEEERQEAMESIRKFEKELEGMPEVQRRMVEQMMGDQVANARRMLEDDEVEMVSRVKEVKVNTGL